jgi:hypothetical protein
MSLGFEKISKQENSVLVNQQQNTRSSMNDLRSALKAVMADMSELSDELNNQQGFKTNNKQESEAKTQTTTNQAFSKQNQKTGETVQFQRAQQQLQQQQGQTKAEQLAEAFAALIEEDDKKLKDKKKSKSFKEKLKVLLNFEEAMQELDFQDPEQKLIMDNFFESMRKMKSLFGKLNRLTKQEQYYEELIEQQKEKTKEGDLKKIPKTENLPKNEGDKIVKQNINFIDLKKEKRKKQKKRLGEESFEQNDDGEKET